MEKQPFSKTVSATYPKTSDEIVVSTTNLADKLILNVQINGIMDTTFDIPVSTSATVRQNSGDTTDGAADDSGIEPKVLMGEVNNIKLEVVATQIGKLVLSTPSREPKSIILSIGSRWFGRGDEHETDDFDKLMFVLQTIKSVI